MKKLVFLTVGLILASWAFSGLGRAQTIELKFAHFMSPMHTQHRNSFEPFCKKVEDLTSGKVKIKLFPGGALGGPTQLPDAVKTGITDIAFIIPSYTTGRFNRFSVLDLPFMVDGAVHATKVIYDIYGEYLSQDFKDYKVLWLYSCGPGQLHTVSKPIQTLNDLKGLKMRAPSAYMSKVLKLAGSTPVSMPISELTVSLQKGVIDGMLTPYSAIADFRLFDLVQYVTRADVYISPMAVVMNKEKFASLPDDARKAIDDASGKNWGLHAAKVYETDDQKTVDEATKLGKIKFLTMAASERQEFIKLVKGMESEWVEEMTKKGLPAKEILAAAHASAEKNR
jgi:TRAP-type C4-dicarboxylate transport system substrate-binding protein